MPINTGNSVRYAYCLIPLKTDQGEAGALREINRRGEEGWRLLPIVISSGAFAIMERPHIQPVARPASGRPVPVTAA